MTELPNIFYDSDTPLDYIYRDLANRKLLILPSDPGLVIPSMVDTFEMIDLEKLEEFLHSRNETLKHFIPVSPLKLDNGFTHWNWHLSLMDEHSEIVFPGKVIRSLDAYGSALMEREDNHEQYRIINTYGDEDLWEDLNPSPFFCACVLYDNIVEVGDFVYDFFEERVYLINRAKGIIPEEMQKMCTMFESGLGEGKRGFYYNRDAVDDETSEMIVRTVDLSVGFTETAYDMLPKQYKRKNTSNKQYVQIPLTPVWPNMDAFDDSAISAW